MLKLCPTMKDILSQKPFIVGKFFGFNFFLTMQVHIRDHYPKEKKAYQLKIAELTQFPTTQVITISMRGLVIIEEKKFPTMQDFTSKFFLFVVGKIFFFLNPSLWGILMTLSYIVGSFFYSPTMSPPQCKKSPQCRIKRHILPHNGGQANPHEFS